MIEPGHHVRIDGRRGVVLRVEFGRVRIRWDDDGSCSWLAAPEEA